MSAPLVSLITCTGFRPEALAMCQKFLERQTFKGEMNWVIIRDDLIDTPIQSKRANLKIQNIKGPRLWDKTYNTHRGNMEAGLTLVKDSEYIFVIEDDDYYAPDYVEKMLGLLRYVTVAGLSYTRYFHVKMPGWKVHPNNKHASLSQTAIRKPAASALMTSVNSGDLYFDGVFWNSILEDNIPHALLGNTGLSIGIKGMPGREGITPSHRELRDYLIDPTLTKLKEWIGEDYKLYLNYKAKYGKENETERPTKQEHVDGKKVTNTKRKNEVQAPVKEVKLPTAIQEAIDKLQLNMKAAGNLQPSLKFSTLPLLVKE